MADSSVKVMIQGKEFTLPAEVAKELLAKKGKGKSKVPSIDEIRERHPWIGEGAELGTVESGGNFKYTVDTSCQAGKLVRSTSQYSGPDTVTPIRVDHGKAEMRVFDYSLLPECGSPIRKATSDLHQSHLCEDCRKVMKKGAKKTLAAVLKELRSQKVAS